SLRSLVTGTVPATRPGIRMAQTREGTLPGPGPLAFLPKRRLPIGAELVEPDLAHFRVWAPAAKRVDAVFADGRTATSLAAEPDCIFSAAAAARTGLRYGFRLDGGEKLYPDPASRFQPDGPHGLSEIIDPAAFAWTDQRWQGASRHGQVVY